METFRSSLTQDDLYQAPLIPTTPNEYVRVGEYKVLAGEMISTGYGTYDTQDQSVGRIYNIFMDDSTPPVELKGTFRLTAMTSFDRPYKILFESSYTALDQNGTDRSKQLPFADDSDLWISQDKRLELSFKCTSATSVNIDTANSACIVDITRAAV
jgi:hypothetical protein